MIWRKFVRKEKRLIPVIQMQHPKPIFKSLFFDNLINTGVTAIDILNAHILDEMKWVV